MNIFNSLGSNYTPRFMIGSLFRIGRKAGDHQLCKVLEKHFGGKALLTYKGRQALKEAVVSLGLQQEAKVGINGFTCYVVWQAVVDAGCTPVFIDVAPDSLHFDASTLQKAYEIYPDMRAVIVQNTLGIACNIESIESFCRARQMALIEDLAHSMGIRYADNREAGLVGDAVMLSFSQDKPLDAVAGGALVYKKTDWRRPEGLTTVRRRQGIVNRLYPLFSGAIRFCYILRVGSLLHAGLKMLHLMATPMSGDSTRTLSMSPATASLVLSEWSGVDSVLAHRRTITSIYKQTLKSEVQLKTSDAEACLRFPIFVTNPEDLIAYMRQSGIYVGDTWYDAPIGPKRYMEKTDYRIGMCPNAESAAAHVVNLPTHVHVSKSDAKQIAERVNQWLISQQDQ